MYRGSSQYFKVVRSPQDYYTVWHADARLLDDWWETGCYGSENECWDFIEDREDTRGFILKFYSDA